MTIHLVITKKVTQIVLICVGVLCLIKVLTSEYCV